MRTRYGLSATILALTVVLTAFPASAQPTTDTTEPPPTTTTPPAPSITGTPLGTTGSPLGLGGGAVGASGSSYGTVHSSHGLAFLPPVPTRAPFVLYPSITFSGEYNDNIFLNNSRRESDFIVGATPALSLFLESTTYRWAAGYSFTAEKYWEHSELDEVFQRQTFFLEGSQRLTPRLTLTLSEVFNTSKDTNPGAQQIVAVGRRTSWTNTLSPGLTWQFAPRTSLTTGVSWVMSRYDGAGAVDSDEYRFHADVRHDFSSRFSGSLGYEGRYLDVEGQSGTSTHTPRIGLSYRFTPFLTVAVVGGPSVVVTDQGTEVRPYVDMHLTQIFGWGSLTAFANRSIGAAGGLGDTTENTSFGVLFQAAILRRFVFEIAPTYTISESVAGNAVDVRSFTVDLRAAYRFTDWFALVAAYRYYQQTSDSTSAAIARDVNQNRALLGLQFGWPIRLN